MFYSACRLWISSGRRIVRSVLLGQVGGLLFRHDKAPDGLGDSLVSLRHLLHPHLVGQLLVVPVVEPGSPDIGKGLNFVTGHTQLPWLWLDVRLTSHNFT